MGVFIGFIELDCLIFGFQFLDLIILVVRFGMGKCFGKGMKVLMFDGKLKVVEDVRIGELLMGFDFKLRKVLFIVRGCENMYWVWQNKGIDYRVNESYILLLKKS